MNFPKRGMACLWLLLGSLLPLAAKDSKLAAGPMVGHVDIVEATIWVQTHELAKVAIRYTSPDGETKTSSPIESNKESFFTSHHLLTALKEGTTYTYEVLIDGQVIPRDYPLQFTTQKHWQYRGKPPEFKFTFGSCLFINDKPYDRPGKPYGDRYDILTKIHEVAPNFMFWLGDNTYFRISDFTPTRMNYRHAHTRAVAELQPLLGNVAHYATWDDHDYGPDNSDRSYVYKAEALELFKSYWANPSYGMPENKGVYGMFNYSDVAFFYMDNRYHRAPTRSKDSNKPYWGKEQLSWLKDSLTTTRATFKVIINGNQFHNSNTRFESFVHYQAEYKDFMDWLQLSGIEGVLFITGDRHHTELLKINRKGAYPLYEYTSSPLTSGTPRRFTWELENDLRVEGTLVWDKRNFGMIEVLGEGKSRRLVLSCTDVDGEKRWEKVITKQELQNPR